MNPLPIPVEWHHLISAPRSGVAKSERYSVFAGAVRASEAVRLLLGLAFSAMR